MREREGERSYTQYGTSRAPGKTGLHIRTYVRIRVHSELYREKGEWGASFSCSSAPNVLSKERNVGR